MRRRFESVEGDGLGSALTRAEALLGMEDADSRFTDLPTPDRIFLQVDPVEIKMRPHPHEAEEIRFSAQDVLGGRSRFEITVLYEYGGRQCHQHVMLDHEDTKALRDALEKAFDADRRSHP